MLGIYLGEQIGESPIATLYLAPTNIFNLIPLPLGATNWTFETDELTVGQTYTLAAWIDGNNNRIYDEGEPIGFNFQGPVQLSSTIGTAFLTITDDSDNDNLDDWWEIHWFGNLNQDAFMDYDNDGLSNLEELNLIEGPLPNLEPNNWDSDGDEMDDGWELNNNLDPTSSTGDDGATGDPDGDTLNNLFEYRGPDGIGPKAESFFGTAMDTGSSDTMNPQSSDTDDDAVADNVEVLQDLTHPAHSMNSTNYHPRSMSMAVNGSNGIDLTDPTWGTDLFAFGKGAGTVEFWIYPESNTTDGLIYYFPTATNGDDHFRISLTDGRPMMEMLTGSNVFAYVGGDLDSVEQLPVNTWSHVAFVWSPANNSLELYVDAVLLIARKTFIKPDMVKGPPRICDGFDSGYIDELRVWDYARTASDIDHWSGRIYPAPGYVQVETRRYDGNIMQNYEYGFPLIAYYRFDDAGETIENYAHLNDTNYALASAAAAAVSDSTAARIIGSDDADGDGVPEWWVSLHNMEKYPEYYSTRWGPFYIPCTEDPLAIQDFEYFRSFIAYASAGNGTAWFDDPDDPRAKFHTPKSQLDFDEGVYSTYMKYIYIHDQPLECKIELFTPGMVSTILYVNGTQITTEGAVENQLQTHEIAPFMKLGRNMIYVECESEFELRTSPASRFGTFQEYRDADPYISEFIDCGNNSYQFKHAVGKFDARLVCNGQSAIIRGDESRADPRAVWHCQTWSTGTENFGGYHPIPDEELRYLPGNQDYGVPANAERDNNPLNPSVADDNLDLFYEFIAGTNPRDKDSDNNGIPDGAEDFDGDGLVNSDEQTYGSSPWLADTDDDGLIDGQDTGSSGHPSESLSPIKNLSFCFGGSQDDFLEIPKNYRFALEKWTIEAWVKLDANETDGGIIVQRMVNTNAVNYELGLNTNNVPYVRFVPNFGLPEALLEAPMALTTGTWTHVAASYYSGDLNIFVGGTNVGSLATANAPGVYGGGPILQHAGRGLNGCIDELRIWSRNRSETEIISNRDGVLTGLESTLVAYYRFDDNTSYTTNGPSGVVGTSANNGTNSIAGITPWNRGQVQDFVLAYGADWMTEWAHGATIHGNLQFSPDSAVLGPPQLQVFIEPQEANLDGAQWSFNGGASWNSSGHLETRIDPGAYSISFQRLDNWLEPSVTNVLLERGSVTIITNRYVATASLLVTLNNSAEVTDAATWTVDGGLTWYRPGERVEELTPGEPGLDIIFSDISAIIPGFSAPASIHVVLNEGEDRIVTTQYAPIQGNVRVTLDPLAIADLTRWRISGNTNWIESGMIVSNLSYGIHTIEYLDVSGYESPVQEQITILDEFLIDLDRTYIRIPEPTSLLVTIEPPDAITAGAQWRLGGGAWQNSGEPVLTETGFYTINYREIEGFFRPQDVTVEVVDEVQTRVVGTYGRLDSLGGYGFEPGQFRSPRGLHAANGKLYVTDSGNHRVQVLDLSNNTWTVYGNTEEGIPVEGTGTGEFSQPFGLAVGMNGDIWVADSGNFRIQKRSASTGTWQIFGTQGSNIGELDVPYDISLDSTGSVYVADHHNSRIQKLVNESTWIDFIPNGPPTPSVRYPRGIEIDSSNQVYVADYDEALGVHRVRLFDASGILITDVGTAESGGLNIPTGLAFGTNGNLFVVSKGSNTIHEADVSNPLNTTWEIILPADILTGPHDIAVSDNGDLYIADTENHRIVRLPVDDSDGDGVPNPVEDVAGTNPFDEKSRFVLKAEQTITPNGARVISWMSSTGRLYSVAICTDAKVSEWTIIPEFSSIEGTGEEMRYTNNAPLQSMEFYRVGVEKPE